MGILTFYEEKSTNYTSENLSYRLLFIHSNYYSLIMSLRLMNSIVMSRIHIINKEIVAEYITSYFIPITHSTERKYWLNN